MKLHWKKRRKKKSPGFRQSLWGFLGSLTELTVRVWSRGPSFSLLSCWWVSSETSLCLSSARLQGKRLTNLTSKVHLEPVARVSSGEDPHTGRQKPP